MSDTTPETLPVPRVVAEALREAKVHLESPSCKDEDGHGEHALRLVEEALAALDAHAAALTRELEAARQREKAIEEAVARYRKCLANSWLIRDANEFYDAVCAALSPPPSPPPGTESPAAAEPMAWVAYRPAGHQGDGEPAMIFTDRHEADDYAGGDFNEGEEPGEVVPLFPAAPAPAAATPAPAGEAVQDNLREASAVLIRWFNVSNTSVFYVRLGTWNAFCNAVRGEGNLVSAATAFRDALADSVGKLPPRDWADFIGALAPARQDAAAEKGDQ